MVNCLRQEPGGNRIRLVLFTLIAFPPTSKTEVSNPNHGVWVQVFEMTCQSAINKVFSVVGGVLLIERSSQKLAPIPALHGLGCPHCSKAWLYSVHFNNLRLMSAFVPVCFLSLLARCAFVSNLKKSSTTPSLQLSHKDMQAVLQKDLNINVYRDGQWGMYRHQLLTQGIPC